jgi:hypothetical protein
MKKSTKKMTTSLHDYFTDLSNSISDEALKNLEGDKELEGFARGVRFCRDTLTDEQGKQKVRL